jgi:restriction system protein
VHCRQWQADKLGIDAVRELHAALAIRGAAGGFVVCGGRFSREAQRFAAGTPLRLIDGAALALLLAPGGRSPTL